MRASASSSGPNARSRARRARVAARLAAALACAPAAPARAADADAWSPLVRHPVKNAETLRMLEDLAGDPDPALRIEALRAFRAVGSDAAAGRIRARLADADARVRAEALAALAALGLAPAPGEIARAAEDPSPAVRAALFEALASVAGAGDAALARRGLSDPEPAVRAAAAAPAARQVRPAADLLPLLRNDPDLTVRRALLGAMLAGAPEVRADVLRTALATGEPLLAADALDALEPADAAFAEAARARLDGPERADTFSAWGAAARLALAPAAEAGPRRLAGGAGPMLRLAICEALGAFDAEPVHAALRARLLDDPDEWVCRAAARALGRMPSAGARAALEAGLGSPRPRVRLESVLALAARGEAGAAPALAALAADPDAAVQAGALRAVRALDPSAAAPRLAEVRGLLGSPSPAVAAAAVSLLAGLGDRASVPAFRAPLQNIRFGDPHEVRLACLEALLELGEPGFAARAAELATLEVIPPPPGIPARMPDHPAVRAAALRYLERFGGPAQAKALAGGFCDLPPAEIRPALAAALSRLTGRPYRPLPDHTYVEYAVESLAPPVHAPTPPRPGVEPVQP